jgi:glycine/D-amino acid oxidase-like deaminating enzyme
MVKLMARSIELLDEYARESDNAFGLNRRGYLYLTADAGCLASMIRQAEAASAAGAGELRVHAVDTTRYIPADPEGFDGAPQGADLFLDGALLRHHFPFVSDQVVGGLHARTAGWLSAQQLGAWMLEQAETAGAKFIRARVIDVLVEAGSVTGVGLDDGSTIAAETFVNAAGPLLAGVGRMVGIELPVQSEVHAKSGFRDHLGVIPRTAPMIIWNDPQRLDGTQRNEIISEPRVVRL